MFLIAAAALATSTPPTQSVRPGVQARATVRVISGETVSFSKPQPSDSGRQFRDTIVRGADNGPQPAKVMEFE
jgi:hypothetical protein